MVKRYKVVYRSSLLGKTGILEEYDYYYCMREDDYNFYQNIDSDFHIRYREIRNTSDLVISAPRDLKGIVLIGNFENFEPLDGKLIRYRNTIRGNKLYNFECEKKLAYCLLTYDCIQVLL